MLDLAVDLLEQRGRFEVVTLFEALGERGLVGAQAAVARAVTGSDLHGHDAEQAFLEQFDALEQEARAREYDKQRASFQRLPIEQQMAVLREQRVGSSGDQAGSGL